MLRVLIVDDDESLRSVLAYKLTQDLGMVVDEARSGNEAISSINAESKYDLIISDYNMPDGDGAILQNYLVANKIKSYFFFYTSEADIKINLDHDSFLGIIEKPNFHELIEKFVFKICTVKKKRVSFVEKLTR